MSLVRHFLSAVMVMCLCASGPLQADKAQEHYQSGLKFLTAKDYVKAIGEFTHAVSLKNTFAEAYLQRAIAKELLGKQSGFSSQDLCYDLIKASELGSMKAAEMLQGKCTQVCYTPKTAFQEPEMVFCADFSSSVLSKLPDQSADLEAVVSMNLFNNRLTALDPALGNLTHLIHLDVGSNQLTEVGAVIGKLRWLQDLNLSKNSIKSISPEIARLSRLHTLNLRNNDIEILPDAIGQLQELHTLDLSVNHLKTIPACIRQLPRLKVLMLAGNPLQEKEVEALKSVLPGVQIYF